MLIHHRFDTLAGTFAYAASLDEVYALYADPDADFDKLAAEQGRLEEIIQAHDGHNLNVQLERAADALRLPDWDAKVEKTVRRRAPPRGA
ncbi:putative ABC transporter ATP-binding protein, partial [Salmonella enterica subsp. enterica serovar Heidelberg str. SARA32]